MTLIGIAGSRELPEAMKPLVRQAVEAIAAKGKGIATGCAKGTDAEAVAAAPVVTEKGLPFWVYAQFEEDGRWAWPGTNREAVQRAEGTGVNVVYAAGGHVTDLRQRLHNRTVQMVEAVAKSGEGAGLIAFFGQEVSPGTRLSVTEAIAHELPVVAFTTTDRPPRIEAEWKRCKWLGGCWVLAQ
ncbi:MAG: hypothetical protein KIT87_26955 [Anaerolineae bacterium]|nr:hypothetical protein [Anaerolineae bacterium]